MGEGGETAATGGEGEKVRTGSQSVRDAKGEKSSDLLWHARTHARHVKIKIMVGRERDRTDCYGEIARTLWYIQIL